MSLRENSIGKAYYGLVESLILPGLRKTNLTPNQVSAAGLVLAALVPLGFLVHPASGLILMILSGLTDSLDGLVARANNMITPFGAFLDSTLDRVSDFFYLTGFWVLFWKAGTGLFAATGLVFSAYMFSVLISYTKARAGDLGCECSVGFMERGLRTVYLLFWALFLSLADQSRLKVLWIGLIIFWLLTLGTFLQRFFYIRKHLASSPAPQGPEDEPQSAFEPGTGPEPESEPGEQDQ